jgi:hypothetical protein
MAPGPGRATDGAPPRARLGGSIEHVPRDRMSGAAPGPV